MAIILDADVIISSEKGAFDLATWAGSLPDETFEIAAITIAELWHGVERASRTHKARRLQFLEAIIANLPIIPYTEQTAYEHARIWGELEAVGKMIGYYDVIVAATALERGSSVATFNQRHFSQIKGLSLVLPQMNAK